jgi:hypothetical protein
MRHKKALGEMLSVQWIGILGAVAGMAALLVPPDSGAKWWLLGFLVLIVGVAVVLEGHRHRLSLFTSGLVEYVPSFPEHRNAEVLAEVKRDYCYLGVTFSSLLTSFCNWFERHRPAAGRVRLLLADPDNLALYEAEAAFRLGPGAADEKELKRTAQARIEEQRNALRRLAKLGDRSHIQIRFHTQLLHQWLHVVDDRLLYAGLLRHGDDGLECPMAVLQRRVQPGLYDHYHGWFEFLWQDAESREIKWAEYE